MRKNWQQTQRVEWLLPSSKLIFPVFLIRFFSIHSNCFPLGTQATKREHGTIKNIHCGLQNNPTKVGDFIRWAPASTLMSIFAGYSQTVLGCEINYLVLRDAELCELAFLPAAFHNLSICTSFLFAYNVTKLHPFILNKYWRRTSQRHMTLLLSLLFYSL